MMLSISGLFSKLRVGVYSNQPGELVVNVSKTTSNLIALVLACSVLSTTLFPNPVYAQARGGSLSDSLKGEAKEAFNRGLTMYKVKNFSGALVEFQKAYGISSDDRLQFNIGVTLRQLERYAESVEAFRKVSESSQNTVSKKQKEQSSSAIEQLQKFTAPLMIKSNAVGATILIDDREVAKTPLAKPLIVSVGERKITLRKSGFLDFTKKINISGGTRADLEANLEATIKKSFLTVTSNVKAIVLIDGVEQGPTTWKGTISAGKHTITLRSDGMVEETKSDVYEADTKNKVNFDLRRAEGFVRVESHNSKDEIKIDGQRKGFGNWSGKLGAGFHHLVVSRSGTQPFVQDFNLQADQNRTIPVSLQSTGGVAWYWWAAGGALLVGGGIAAFLIAKPKSESATPGTINPGSVSVGYHF
jgi:hypothetical protein